MTRARGFMGRMGSASSSLESEPISVSAPAEFESFFREEYGRLARALFLLTGEAAEADDLAQEAMARTFERWDRVRAMDSPQGYVYRTAMNLHRKHLRRRAVWARIGPTASNVVEDTAEGSAERSVVLSALAGLPRGQREAIVLVAWLGLTAEEAGRLLGIDASSVRGRIHRARAILHRRLGGGTEDG